MSCLTPKPAMTKNTYRCGGIFFTFLLVKYRNLYYEGINEESVKKPDTLAVSQTAGTPLFCYL